MYRLKFIRTGIRTPFKVAAGLLVFAVAASHLAGQPVTYEGYGSASRGGAGGDTYHVTTLADGGPGSLRDGVFNRAGPRTIVFDVAGTITISNLFNIKSPYLTIDGATAPAPGITITKTVDTVEFFIAGTHDIILRHLRFLGLYPNGAPFGQANTAIMGIDGDSGPDHHAQNIVVDHVTILNATDSGIDLWGEISDVTVSWCLIANCYHPCTASHIPDPGQPFQKRRRISMHHNVWAHNGERNPQLRADNSDFEYVNNIVYDWDRYGYGVRVRNEAGEPKVNADIINNLFYPGSGDPTAGLIFGQIPGPDATESGPLIPVPQGTVITNSTMGELWVAGNILPLGNLDQYSTIPAPHPVPTNAVVTTYRADELIDRVLPNAGTKYRTADEQSLLSKLISALGIPMGFRIASVTDSNCVLEFNAPAGFQNDVQYSDTLAPPTWQSLTNFDGNGDVVDITNTLTGIAARFYRVITTELR